MGSFLLGYSSLLTNNVRHHYRPRTDPGVAAQIKFAKSGQLTSHQRCQHGVQRSPFDCEKQLIW